MLMSKQIVQIHPCQLQAPRKFHTTSVDMAKVSLFLPSKADHVLDRGLGMHQKGGQGQGIYEVWGSGLWVFPCRC